MICGRMAEDEHDSDGDDTQERIILTSPFPPHDPQKAPGLSTSSPSCFNQAYFGSSISKLDMAE